MITSSSILKFKPERTMLLVPSLFGWIVFVVGALVGRCSWGRVLGIHYPSPQPTTKRNTTHFFLDNYNHHRQGHHPLLSVANRRHHRIPSCPHIQSISSRIFSPSAQAASKTQHWLRGVISPYPKRPANEALLVALSLYQLRGRAVLGLPHWFPMIDTQSQRRLDQVRPRGTWRTPELLASEVA